MQELVCLFKFWKLYWKLKSTLIIDKSNQQVFPFSDLSRPIFAEKIVAGHRWYSKLCIKSSKNSEITNSYFDSNSERFLVKRCKNCNKKSRSDNSKIDNWKLKKEVKKKKKKIIVLPVQTLCCSLWLFSLESL